MFGFLYSFIYLRSLWCTIFLIAGIIMLIVWKAKKKGKVYKAVSIGMVVLPLVVIAAGFVVSSFDGHTSMIHLSRDQLKAFAQEAITDQQYLDLDKFLPNNVGSEKTKSKDDVIVKQRHVTYQRNSDLAYFLTEYKDTQTAKDEFAKLSSESEPSESLTERISTEGYDLLAIPVEFESVFFDWHVGDLHSTSIWVYIRHDKYVIAYMETTERCRPLFYNLAKNNLFFDEGYTLKTRDF